MRKSRQHTHVSMQGQLAPPPLSATLLQLWHREFDRFPVGYFTQSDVSGMVVYLQTPDEYDSARQMASRARAAVTQREEREEVRAIRRQLITLQRALRMYPVTRAHPSSVGRLASDRAKQVDTATDEPMWRQLMRGVDKAN